MSKPNLKAEFVSEWADGEFLFALKAGQIEELEKICDEGIGKIAFRCFSGTDFTYKHVRETIRLALIGGGMPAVEAERKAKTYIDGCPIDHQGDPFSNLKTARKVLQAVYFGWEDLPPLGEAEAGETPATEPTSETSEQPS
ncbi:gene transfer agent family protein [Pelagibacterium sp. H642]|uniref:gene transfer agent family protein n=1 Tax=Pelagibacterium sp. H642 TaxID=1881069 RepID=UPI0028158720|nr:gene transfer agent family protein [Pelagibacterium sp. H642]WMT90156.1 gene transfer agent family protein [Pelagibacterium sp. H642]